MPTGDPDKNQKGAHYLTLPIVGRVDIFTRKTYRDVFHNNPVRAGWVENSEEYIYSSTKNYAGERGLVNVEVDSRKWKTVK